MKAPSEEIYGKSTQGTMLKSTISGLQLTTLSLTIQVYLHSFSYCCVPSLLNPTKFSENSN